MRERKPVQKWIIAHSLTNYNNCKLLIVLFFLYFFVLLSLLFSVLLFLFCLDHSEIISEKLTNSNRKSAIPAASLCFSGLSVGCHSVVTNARNEFEFSNKIVNQTDTENIRTQNKIELNKCGIFFFLQALGREIGPFDRKRLPDSSRRSWARTGEPKRGSQRLAETARAKEQTLFR